MMGIYYGKLLVMIAVAVFYTNMPNYFNWSDIIPADSAPIRWIIGFGLLSLPFLLIQGLRSDILKSPLTLWCFGYAWIAMAGFLLSSQSDIAWQEVRWRFIAIVELMMFMTLFAHEELARLARQAIVVAVLFGVAVNIYELFDPMSFSRVLGRSAGLYMNPNQAGQALVLGMIFGISVLPAWSRAPFILLTGIGIFPTFSRSAILEWVIIVVSFMLMRRVRPRDFFLAVAVSLLLVAVLLLPRLDQFLTTLDSSGVINKNVAERLDWFTDPTGVSDDSSWERSYLLKQAWDKTAEHPFLGSGTGTSREVAMGAHNQYLMFMQDHGLLGAAILPLLVLAVTWGARGEVRNLAIIFGGTVILQGFMSHDILNQLELLMLFALMAVMSSGSRESEMKKTQAMITAETDRPRGFAKA
jgi:O-antigen ligase